MPIYEYRCTACGRTMEMLQRVDDPPASECAHCQGKLEKLFSAPSFQFKGSGWYATDYGNTGSVKSDGAEDKSSSTTGDTASSSAGDHQSSESTGTGTSTGDTSATATDS